MQGLVTKSTGSGYRVLLDDGSSVLCHIKGNLRIRGIRTTNPVAVGDRVQITLTDAVGPTAEGGPTGEAGHVGWITNILPRRNYIIRRATNLSKQAHILAANLDQVALIVTIRHPETSTTFIDRFLATAEAYRIPAVLIFNKIDLLTPDELDYLNSLRQLYESLNYPTYAICAKKLPITYNLLPLFQGKTTLLAGNSGVGKSTLLNALFGRELTRTADLSDAHDTGMHTTTFSEMYRLTNGWIIDVPGVKGFGSVEMEPHEVSHYFRDIFRIGQSCRYSDCLHTGEPGCAVREALTASQSPITNHQSPIPLALSRYESYLSMLGDSSEQKYR
ncbi:MAG: ribosome small subunit-dependent GTPase A [Paludibacteraceae bacterium]|nr:ribosome small subunit-dependent GTPase A [Paludibacteraceae bacterium]